jgi:hypothetical protein
VNRVLFLPALLFLSACQLSPPPANGWAVATADPRTGDVGVAGAACGESPLDYRAVLVPGKGAGVLMGVNSPLRRDRFGAQIEQPLPAPAIVANLTASTDDPDAAIRQYGIVTLAQGTAQVSAFSGAQLAPSASEATDSASGIVAVGSGMQKADSSDRMLSAFQTSNASLSLPDRLMRALEAGSASGGTSLCNRDGVSQTASTAFLMFARAGDPVFQVKTLGGAAPAEPDPPYLALSTTEPKGGRNAILTLRDQYDLWRAKNLPPCPDCAQARISVPAGGSRTVPADAFLSRYALWLVAGFILLVILLTAALYSLPRRTHNSGSGASRSGQPTP